MNDVMTASIPNPMDEIHSIHEFIDRFSKAADEADELFVVASSATVVSVLSRSPLTDEETESVLTLKNKVEFFGRINAIFESLTGSVHTESRESIKEARRELVRSVLPGLLRKETFEYIDENN